MRILSLKSALVLAAILNWSTSYGATSSVPLKSNPFGYFTTLEGDVVFTCNKDVPKSPTRVCHVDSDPDWTPLLATDHDSPGGYFNIAKLDDGQLHWTYRGRPVYVAAPLKGRGSPWKRPGHRALWRDH